MSHVRENYLHRLYTNHKLRISVELSLIVNNLFDIIFTVFIEKLQNTSTLFFAVAFKSSVTFANKMSRQVTTLSVFYASSSDCWIFAFVYV